MTVCSLAKGFNNSPSDEYRSPGPRIVLDARLTISPLAAGACGPCCSHVPRQLQVQVPDTVSEHNMLIVLLWGSIRTDYICTLLHPSRLALSVRQA